MLRDRVVGVLCLGAAVVAATWGGNTVLHRMSETARAHADPSVSAGAIGPAPAGPDTPTTAPAPPDPNATVPASATTSSTAARPGAAPTTTRPGEAPAVQARRALLAPADVPAGFTVASPAPPPGADQPDSPFERCLGADGAKLTTAINARARSATFTRADTGSASSSVAVFDQPATAQKVLGLLTTASARSCFEGLINARLARNPNLSQDVKGSLGPAPSPAVGEGALAYRFDVRLPAEDVDRNAGPDDPPIRYVADFLFVRKGRALVLAEFDNLRQPWAETALRGVVTNLVAHV